MKRTSERTPIAITLIQLNKTGANYTHVFEVQTETPKAMEIVRAQIKARLTNAIFADGESAISEAIDVFQITDDQFDDGLKDVNRAILKIQDAAFFEFKQYEYDERVKEKKKRRQQKKDYFRNLYHSNREEWEVKTKQNREDMIKNGKYKYLG